MGRTAGARGIEKWSASIWKVELNLIQSVGGDGESRIGPVMVNLEHEPS